MESHHAVADALLNQGLRCEFYKHKEIKSCLVSKLTPKIKSGLYNMLWISMPRRPQEKHLIKQRNIFMEQLRLLINLAVCTQTPIVLFGITGDHWQDAQLLQLVQDGVLQRSSHRLCHFGIKVNLNNQSPSAVAFQMLATGG